MLIRYGIRSATLLKHLPTLKLPTRGIGMNESTFSILYLAHQDVLWHGVVIDSHIRDPSLVNPVVRDES